MAKFKLVNVTIVAVAIGLASAALHAQPGPKVINSDPITLDQPTSPKSSTNNPARSEKIVVKEVGPGIFELGDIRIDKNQRTVSFPAVLNLAEGQMEYFLVTSGGKVHESILRTETSPYRINIAMLLLGVKTSATNSPRPDTATKNPQQFVPGVAKQIIRGEPITVEIKWRTNGKEIRKKAEELVYNTESKSSMRAGGWIYNGSRIVEQTFVAEQQGSVIALVADPDALMVNQGPGKERDTIWAANTNNLPPSGVPLEVTIRENRAKN